MKLIKPLLSIQNRLLKLLLRMIIMILKLLFINKSHPKFWFIQKNRFNKVIKTKKRIKLLLFSHNSIWMKKKKSPKNLLSSNIIKLFQSKDNPHISLFDIFRIINFNNSTFLSKCIYCKSNFSSLLSII